MLILREPISGTSSFTRLQLVPNELVNIIFIAFHTNPIGGHLNAYRTYHRIWLRFYWPGMYAYVKRMCIACPGCALSNPTCGKSSELVYNFPIEAPFLVMFFYDFAAGKHAGYESSECYLIGCCGMCGFACMPHIARVWATTFVSSKSWKSSCGTGFVTPSCSTSTRAASSLVYAMRQLMFSKLIVTFYQVPTTIPWSLNESIATWWKA